MSRSTRKKTLKAGLETNINDDIIQGDGAFVPSYKIVNRPSAGSVIIYLGKDQAIFDRYGYMNYCDGSIKINVNLQKGIAGIFKLLKGEDAFDNYYQGTTDIPAPVCFSSDFPGDVISIKIRPGDKYVFNTSSFLCATVNLNFGILVRLRNIFGGGDVVLKTASLKEGDAGMLWLKADGGYEKVVIESGKTMRIHNNLFCVAKAECKYELTGLGGFKSSLLSGEGIIMKFKGPCEIYIHSRNNEKFIQILKSIIKSK